MADIERAWTLQGSGESVTGYCNITVDGPQLPVGKRVDVVPAEQLRGAVEAYRDIVSWARTTFDLADRPDYGDGIEQLLERHGLESLPPNRSHRRA